jgi:predicted permease
MLVNILIGYSILSYGIVALAMVLDKKQNTNLISDLFVWLFSPVVLIAVLYIGIKSFIKERQNNEIS